MIIRLTELDASGGPRDPVQAATLSGGMVYITCLGVGTIRVGTSSDDLRQNRGVSGVNRAGIPWTAAQGLLSLRWRGPVFMVADGADIDVDVQVVEGLGVIS
jgi:hypothetical protein